MPPADTSYRTSAIPRLRHTYYAIFLATTFSSLLFSSLCYLPQPHLSRCDTLPVSPLPSPEKNVRQPIRVPDALS